MVYTNHAHHTKTLHCEQVGIVDARDSFDETSFVLAVRIDDCAFAFGVEGVLYLISEANLARLDSFEGYPKVYRRLWLEVEFDGGIYQAITYEMSRWTKFIRRRKRYPEEYRKICSFGADYYGIKNNFKK